MGTNWDFFWTKTDFENYMFLTIKDFSIELKYPFPFYPVRRDV